MVAKSSISTKSPKQLVATCLQRKSIKITLIILSLVFILSCVFLVNESLTISKVHRTFADYYAFRGCVQLLARTDNSGLCKLSSGQIIKIVKFQDRWYLDGDLPICWSNICF